MAALVLLAVVGFLVLRYANIDAVRGATERRLSSLTGRDVTLAGDFTVAPSLTPTVTAQQLSIADAPWASRAEMLVAETVEVELEILPLLLRGDVEIDRFVLHGAEIHLERGPEGRLNWQFDPAPDSEEAGPAAENERILELRALTVTDSTLVWHGAGGATETAAIERLSWRSDERGGALAIEAEGRYLERAFSLDGELGTLAALRSSAASPLVLDVRFGAAQLHAEGDLALPLAGSATELSLAARGRDDDLLQAFLGRDLPQLDEWQLDAEVSGGQEALRASAVAARADLAEGLAFVVSDGSVEDLLDGSGIALPVVAEAPSLAGIEALAQTDLPDLGAFRAEGRLAGSLDRLSLENTAGWLGASEAAPLLLVTGGRIEDVIDGSGFDLQLRAPQGGAAAVAAAFGWAVDYDEFGAEAHLSGDIASLALQGLEAEAVKGDARLQLSGSIGNLPGLAQLHLNAAAAAPSLADFTPLVGIELPETPPFSLSGHLQGGDDVFILDSLAGSIADSRLRGQFEIALPEAAVPQVTGRLSADRLDLDRLWPTEQEPETGDASLDLPHLDRAEAMVALRAEEVVARERRFRDVNATLRLEDERLAIEDLTARIAGGTLAGEAALDAGVDEIPEDMAEVVLSLQAEDIELAELVTGLPGQARGRLDVTLNVDSTGRTLDQLGENLEGEAAAFGEEGELENVPLNRMIPDLDITHILPFFRGRETTVRVNCLIGEFDIDNGVARTDSMLDTTRMTLLGQGAVDLAENTVDFELRPVGKSRKLSASSVPVDIEGPLTDPQIRPRVGEAVGGALRGFLGGLLIPLNQISALFGDDARDACGEALAEARERRGVAPLRPPP